VDPRHVAPADLPRILERAPERRAESIAAYQPMVSVVVPHFNLGEYVRETVSSALASTYPRLEVVVVDDGSTDPESLAIVRGLATPRVRVIEKPNGGLASARNAGVRAARGELILPLDADDLVDPRYVSAAVEAHRRVPELAFVTCHAAFFRRRVGDIPREGWVPVGLHAPALLFGNCASTCSAVIKREALEAAGGFDESWEAYEDWDLWCTMAERRMVSGVLPEVLFHYRIRTRSMVRTTARERDRQLRSRMVRRHPALAREHGAAAFLAHVAVCAAPDLRILPGTKR
jgi:cellulose synthase/poly-beta-1,6-N-acetylglucosamine synthase-like glycosyltransferase